MTRLPHPRPAWFVPALLALAACAHTPPADDAAAVVGDSPNTAVVAAPLLASNEPSLAEPTASESASAGAMSTETVSTELAADATAASGDPLDATQTDPATDASATDARTQAERDFDALYGVQSDPFADPTLPDPATLPSPYDPWEGFNRRMHRFNNAVDRRVAKPLAKAYIAVTPRPVRLGVTNFFNNLGQPVSAVNALLQGKPKQALQSFGRFLLNSTLGIAGIFDPASDAKLPNRGEDFGQTLGIWGWKQSRYVEVPLFGPRTVRDLFGMVGDAPLSPLRQVGDDPARVFLQGLQLVDLRTQLMALDGMREGAADDYALLRDSWLQRRNYQIFGDRQLQDEALPDYLREEYNPTVPIDAIPVTPMGTP